MVVVICGRSKYFHRLVVILAHDDIPAVLLPVLGPISFRIQLFRRSIVPRYLYSPHLGDNCMVMKKRPGRFNGSRVVNHCINSWPARSTGIKPLLHFSDIISRPAKPTSLFHSYFSLVFGFDGPGAARIVLVPPPMPTPPPVLTWRCLASSFDPLAKCSQYTPSITLPTPVPQPWIRSLTTDDVEDQGSARKNVQALIVKTLGSGVNNTPPLTGAQRETQFSTYLLGRPLPVYGNRPIIRPPSAISAS